MLVLCVARAPARAIIQILQKAASYSLLVRSNPHKLHLMHRGIQSNLSGAVTAAPHPVECLDVVD